MAQLLSYAEMTRRPVGDTISGTLPATAYPIYKPMMISATDSTTGEHTFVLATARVDGFLSRASATFATITSNADPYLLWSEVSGSQTADASYVEGVYETPFEVSKPGSILPAEPGVTLELEGTDYLGSSADAETVVDCEMNVETGKWEEATAGDIVQGICKGNLSANPKTTGNARLLIMLVQGYQKNA